MLNMFLPAKLLMDADSQISLNCCNWALLNNRARLVLLMANFLGLNIINVVLLVSERTGLCTLKPRAQCAICSQCASLPQI